MGFQAAKKYRYLDSNGKEIDKDAALDRMGGLIWHVDLADLSKSSLRCRGRFISLQDAQAVVVGLRTGDAMANAGGLKEPPAPWAPRRLRPLGVYLQLLFP